MDQVCPKCGARSSKKKFIKGFCIDCYSSKIDVFAPERLDISVCRSCDKIKTRGWISKNKKNLEALIISKCRGRYSKAYVSLEGTPSVTFVIETDNSFIKIKKELSIEFKGELCTECSRVSSGYYEAIIQLRGKKEMVERKRKKVITDLERKTSIAKIEELKEGPDIYVVSKEKALEVLSSFGKKFTTSNKLFGVKDGQRVYRTTFCVRLD